MLKKILNRRPDTAKPPHLKFGQEISAVDLRPLNPPIYDQGQFGSCTGNAWARLLEFLQLKEIRAKLYGMPEEFGISYTPLSRLFIYFCERALHHDTQADDGAELADGANVALNKGVCPEAMWPYDQHDLLSIPTEPCFGIAAKHKIKQLMSIDNGNIQQMKTCLLQGFPFVAGFSVPDTFMSEEMADGGVMSVEDWLSQNIVGGHAICFVGFDDATQSFIVANSWGTDWGDAGYFYVPYEIVANENIFSDFWTARI